MASCSTCGTPLPESFYGYTCNACKIQEKQTQANEEIVRNNRITEEHMRANEQIAHDNIQVQANLALVREALALQKHNELMKQEEIRNSELKKQTRILMELNLKVDEVYEEGFNFELKDIALDSQGCFVPIYQNPFVTEKLRKAYKKGVDDRFKRDYPKGPGKEYMSKAAFNNGYRRLQEPRIFFPDMGNKLFPDEDKPFYIFEAQRTTEISESVNTKDGSINYKWFAPYESETLNQSFAAGVDKYKKEQNTLANNEARLVEVRKQKAQKKAWDRVIRIKAKEASDSKAARSGIKRAFDFATFGFAYAIPTYLILWFFSMGEISWTFMGFVTGTTLISGFIGLYWGFKAKDKE
jgi:hypothetical protein